MKNLARYSLAFLLGTNPEGAVKSVLFILKAKPKWQAGRLNGVGGSLLEGEAPSIGAVREVEEESRDPHQAVGRGVLDLSPTGVRHYAVLRGAETYHREASNHFEIHLFTAHVPEDLLVAATRATYAAREPLRLVTMAELFLNDSLNVLPNVRWMVSMARSWEYGESAQFFDVREARLEDFIA